MAPPKQLRVSHIGEHSATLFTDDEGAEYALPFEEWLILTMPLILPRYRECCDLNTPEGFEAVRRKWKQEQERAERDYQAQVARRNET